MTPPMFGRVDVVLHSAYKVASPGFKSFLHRFRDSFSVVPKPQIGLIEVFVLTR